MKCFLPNKHYHSFFHTCWPMDCSPQGFNHRSQHLQIHPAMHKTTQNETKLWKIKSPPSWSVLLQMIIWISVTFVTCRSVTFTNLPRIFISVSTSPPPPICFKSPSSYFPNIFLRFVFYSSLFFPVYSCLPALTQGHYILSFLQPQMDPLDSILELKAETRMTYPSFSVFLYV